MKTIAEMIELLAAAKFFTVEELKQMSERMIQYYFDILRYGD